MPGSRLWPRARSWSPVLEQSRGLVWMSVALVITGGVQRLVVWVPPGIIVMSKGCVALGYMPTWVACTAPWGHADNLTEVTTKDHVCVHDPATARVCVNVPDPWCYQGLRRCLGSGLQADTVFVSEGCASAGAKWIWSRLWTAAMILSGPRLQVRAHVWVYDQTTVSVCAHICGFWDRLRPCWGWGCGLTPGVMLVYEGHVAAGPCVSR